VGYISEWRNADISSDDSEIVLRPSTR